MMSVILYGTLPFDAGLPPSPADWPTGQCSWPRVTTTTSSPARFSTGPGPTCWPSPGTHGRPPAAWRPSAQRRHDPPARGLDRPPTRVRLRPRSNPRGTTHRSQLAGNPAEPLVERGGPRPEVSWTIPQQETQNAPADLQERLFDELSGLPGVEVGPSRISRRQARPGLHPARRLHRRARVPGPQVGEFAHLHPPYDGSLQVVLPDLAAAPTDAVPLINGSRYTIHMEELGTLSA